MRRVRDVIVPVVYHSLRLLSGGASRVYYSRIDVRHAERIPARGPLIIAANHPASLTDVLVLGAMLPRRAHFVAYSGLFKPWPMGLLLRLAGTVPVYRQQEGAENMHRNQEMFRACNETLASGGPDLHRASAHALTNFQVRLSPVVFTQALGRLDVEISGRLVQQHDRADL